MHIFKKFRRSNNSRRRQSRWRFGTKSAKNFENRTVNVGHRELDFGPETEVTDASNEEAEVQIEFVDNTIKSSKYTILTFLPK